MKIDVQHLPVTGSESFGDCCGRSHKRPRFAQSPYPGQGSLLRDFRVALGLSLREAARLADCLPTELAAIEMERGAYLLPKDLTDLCLRLETQAEDMIALRLRLEP